MLDNISEMNINEVKKYIKTILYSTTDQILTILDDGSIVVSDK